MIIHYRIKSTHEDGSTRTHNSTNYFEIIFIGIQRRRFELKSIFFAFFIGFNTTENTFFHNRKKKKEYLVSILLKNVLCYYEEKRLYDPLEGNWENFKKRDAAKISSRAKSRRFNVTSHTTFFIKTIIIIIVPLFLNFPV